VAPAFSITTSNRKGFWLDNLAIARILREVADLLEVKSDNPFKIRAYRNGADIVANHPHALAALDASELRGIPGIGKDLAARIVEIGTTGDAEFHRELVAEFPPTVLDLLHLQGVGPKTVRILSESLAIKSLDELRPIHFTRSLASGDENQHESIVLGKSRGD
jgi:DNA polymerase (family 10)